MQTKISKIKIFISQNRKKVAENAAEFVINEIKRNPKVVLGLPTGKTMIPFYDNLTKISKKKKISFSNVKTFNLDEYYNISPLNKKSFRQYILRNFFGKIDIKKENINFLDGSKKEWESECARYEKKIKKAGGIDLQILGIGKNSHIGFNEPGSSFQSKTRKVKLTEETRKANSKLFQSKRKVPRYALTLGIKTIMSSKKILLLAFGKEKRDAIEKTLRGELTEKVPASILRKHKNVTFIIDKAAFG